MPGSVRLVPNDTKRTLYSIRGIIEEHGIRESGWWIFKKRIPIVCVRIRQDQLVAFNKLAHDHYTRVLDQFFTGSIPLKVVKIQRIDANTALDNEIVSA